MNIYICLENDKKSYKSLYKECYQIDIDLLMHKTNFTKIQNQITKILLNQRIGFEINKFQKSKKFSDLIIFQSKEFNIETLYKFLDTRIEDFNLILIDEDCIYEEYYDYVDQVI